MTTTEIPVTDQEPPAAAPPARRKKLLVIGASVAAGILLVAGGVTAAAVTTHLEQQRVLEEQRIAAQALETARTAAFADAAAERLTAEALVDELTALRAALGVELTGTELDAFDAALAQLSELVTAPVSDDLAADEYEALRLSLEAAAAQLPPLVDDATAQWASAARATLAGYIHAGADVIATAGTAIDAIDADATAADVDQARDAVDAARLSHEANTPVDVPVADTGKTGSGGKGGGGGTTNPGTGGGGGGGTTNPGTGTGGGGGGGTTTPPPPPAYTDADARNAVTSAYPNVRPKSGTCLSINWGTWGRTSVPPRPSQTADSPLFIGYTATSTGDGGKVNYFVCE